MRPAPAFLLFTGTLLAAAGYGATFLLSSYFRERGGSDLDTGLTLGAAMIGTFAAVPIVGWYSGRFDAARMGAIGTSCIAFGFVILAVAPIDVPEVPFFAGGLVGFGWGMFYASAPISLAERIGKRDRTTWFMRFGAFQMCGIGGGPVVFGIMQGRTSLTVEQIFALVSSACLLGSLSLWGYAASDPGRVRSPKLRGWVRQIVHIGRSAALLPLLMIALGACVFTGMMTFQSTFVAGSEATVNNFYVIYVLTAVAGRIIMSTVIKYLHQSTLLVVLVAAMAIGIVAMFGVRAYSGFQILSAALIGVGYGLAYSLIQNMLLDLTPSIHHQAALTWFVLLYFAGIFGFPVIGGWVVHSFGTDALLWLMLAVATTELVLAIWGGARRSDATSGAAVSPGI